MVYDLRMFRLLTEDLQKNLIWATHANVHVNFADDRRRVVNCINRQKSSGKLSTQSRK